MVYALTMKLICPNLRDKNYMNLNNETLGDIAESWLALGRAGTSKAAEEAAEILDIVAGSIWLLSSAYMIKTIQELYLLGARLDPALIPRCYEEVLV